MYGWFYTGYLPRSRDRLRARGNRSPDPSTSGVPKPAASARLRLSSGTSPPHGGCNPLAPLRKHPTTVSLRVTLIWNPWFLPRQDRNGAEESGITPRLGYVDKSRTLTQNRQEGSQVVGNGLEAAHERGDHPSP